MGQMEKLAVLVGDRHEPACPAMGVRGCSETAGEFEPLSEAAASALAGNRVPVAAQLLALSDHPGLDLVVVFIRVGDGTGGPNSGSRLMMEMPRFHNTLRNVQDKRGSPDGGSANRREPSDVIARSRRATLVLTESFVEETRMAKKRKRKYSRGTGTEVKREMHRYKRGKAKSGKGGRGGKVKSRKQAIAIALSKARKKGKKVPRKKK
jgi:hypothetical protein